MGVKSKEGNSKVKTVVPEGAVLQEEVEVVHVVLQFGEPVAKVQVCRIYVEFFGLRSLAQQNQMGSFHGHLCDGQTLLIGLNFQSLPVFADVITPFRLSDECKLVYDIEHDEDACRTSLNKSENQDDPLDPLRTNSISVVIHTLQKDQLCQTDYHSNQR